MKITGLSLMGKTYTERVTDPANQFRFWTMLDSLTQKKLSKIQYKIRENNNPVIVSFEF